MNESPDTIHGRMKEGAHLAGYGLSRAMDNLKWLLEEERYRQLAPGYTNVNEFLRDTRDAFRLLRIDPEERKQIAKLVKELQPEASQRAIADMTGVSKRTIARDLEKGDGANAPKNEEKQGESGANAPPEPQPWTTDETYDPAKQGKTKERRELKKREREPTPVVVVAPATKSPRLIVGRAENMIVIEGESVDLIVTSPPYNMGQEQWPMGGAGRMPREDGIGYSDDLPEGEYQDWQIECLIEMYRVAKWGASLFYNHKIRNRDGGMIHPLDWLRDERNPWILRQEIVWDRGSTHNHSPSLFWPEDERIYWMTKGKPALPNRPIGKSTVWRFHGPVASTLHPAPFDEELPRRCIEAVGRDGIVVLDPFAGSCTTLKVALDFGYEAIGVDICAEYLETARRGYGWTNMIG